MDRFNTSSCAYSAGGNFICSRVNYVAESFDAASDAVLVRYTDGRTKAFHNGDNKVSLRDLEKIKQIDLAPDTQITVCTANEFQLNSKKVSRDINMTLKTDSRTIQLSFEALLTVCVTLHTKTTTAVFPIGSSLSKLLTLMVRQNRLCKNVDKVADIDIALDLKVSNSRGHGIEMTRSNLDLALAKLKTMDTEASERLADKNIKDLYRNCNKGAMSKIFEPPSNNKSAVEAKSEQGPPVPDMQGTIK